MIRQPPAPHRTAQADTAAGRGLRERGFQVIFGHQDRTGRLFDIVLIVAIVASILITLLDSVQALHRQFSALFYLLEWAFTLVFTAEYLV